MRESKQFYSRFKNVRGVVMLKLLLYLQPILERLLTYRCAGGVNFSKMAEPQNIFHKIDYNRCEVISGKRRFRMGTIKKNL